ncbi:hypothetical protein ACR0ST_06620 [Aliidiomarina sp. Khilg15.8]
MGFKTIVQAAGLSALLMVSGASLAEEVREHQFAASDIKHLTVENGVGEIIVRASDDDSIRVSVTLEGNRSGIFRRKTDVSDVDISTQHRGDRLTLSMDVDNVNARWVVYTPAMEKMTLDLGVGNLRVENIEAAISIDVGVGNAEVETRKEWLGEFDASVGVGGISVRGLNEYSNKRQVVAEQGTGRGNGEYPLSIDVGVGDIEVQVK